MQHEIKQPIPLLDESGGLTEPGYAKRLLPVYERGKVKGGLAPLKEWDHYLVMGDGFALTLTIADLTYMGLVSVSLADLREGWQVTEHRINPLTMGLTGLPSTSARGNVAVADRGYGMLFHNDGVNRTLTAHMEGFREDGVLDAHVVLTNEPKESVVLCTPFGKPGHFCLNQKINGFQADGKITVGNKRYDFNLKDSFATLNWGRGVWNRCDTWYWGSASGRLDGVPFGLNIGCGFGDDETATENMLFYGGKAHKLSQVAFRLPQREGKEDLMGTWAFTSDDGRFEMEFLPLLDGSHRLCAGAVRWDQRRIFGTYRGTAVLDDGRRLEVGDLMGFQFIETFP